jgi:hypothetical protein
LRIQLGDHTEQLCRNPKPAHDNDFVIINVHGIHEVALDFCDCANAPSHYRQLLCRRLFPATSTDPRTAATFAVLEHFHLLSFESKVSAYEFYHSLARRSDNTGIAPIKVKLIPSVGTIPTTDQSMRTGSLFSFLENYETVAESQIVEKIRSWSRPCRSGCNTRRPTRSPMPCMPTVRENVLDDLTDVSQNQRYVSFYLLIRLFTDESLTVGFIHYSRPLTPIFVSSVASYQTISRIPD